MIHEFAARRIGYYHTAILFRSLIENKAGRLPKNRLVLCHTTAVDERGNALLVAHDGIHLLFPADALLKPSDEFFDKVAQCAAVIALPEFRFTPSYVGGQELTWDMHMPEPAVLRFFSSFELCEALQDHDAFTRGGHQRRTRQA